MAQRERDYIGIVNIPLRDMLSNSSISRNYPVLDENRNECG
jgi:hypothetical protein